MKPWRAALVLAMVVSGHGAGAQSSMTFHARLSPVPIDVSMLSKVAGSGSAKAVLDGRKLAISGKFEGLRSRATFARLHRAQKGVRGPAVFDLSISKETSGNISGTVELTPTQVEDLKNSRFYIQVYSEGAPDGNLWGWLLP